MGKEVWKAGTVLYPVPAVMVSCGTEDKGNIITVAWTGTINSDPAMVSISIRKERHSFDIIKNSGEFVINLVSKELAFACDYCGVKSGRDIDKFKEMNLTAKKGEKVDAPIIYEAPVNIECKTKDIIHLGTHHMFLAEVVSVSVSDEYLDNTGKFHFDNCEPICYSHGGYYTLGEHLGGFGFSVKKPIKPINNSNNNKNNKNKKYNSNKNK